MRITSHYAQPHPGHTAGAAWHVRRVTTFTSLAE